MEKKYVSPSGLAHYDEKIKKYIDTKAPSTEITEHIENADIHVTSTEKAKWNSAKTHADSSHAPSNAQANVLETVKVNGTALTPSSKSVDITVPTKVGQLINDSGYLTEHQDISGKANSADLAKVATSGSYNDLTNKPSSFTPNSHTHSKSEITDFPTSMTPTAHNQASNTINAMTGYSKPSATGAIATSDSLNSAIGKLEKGLDGKVSATATVNGKALSSNISLTASDVGADASGSASNALASAKSYSDENLKAAKSYADTKVADLIGTAPETMNTIEEVAAAIEAHQDVTDALNAAIGNKVDKVSGKGLSTNDLTSSLKSNYDAAYTHSQSTHARTDATKVEKSSTNGNIKINGTETTVYTHPSGTNPHGTTKSDVGLGNVGNFKAVSTVASQGLSNTEKSNARANIGAGTSSFSGSYNDLSNKPTIPSVGNGTITIKQAGTSKGTFTVNQTGNTTIELTDTDTNTWRPLGTTADTACAGNDSRLSNARPASDVYSWAKASTKPSYSWSEITGKPSTFTPASHTHSMQELTNSLGLGQANVGATWGTVTSNNGYAIRWGADQTGGGGIVIGEKNGQTSVQIDGEIYVSEGAKRLAHTDELLKLGTTSTTAASGNHGHSYLNGDLTMLGHIEENGALCLKPADEYNNSHGVITYDNTTLNKGASGYIFADQIDYGYINYFAVGQGYPEHDFCSYDIYGNRKGEMAYISGGEISCLQIYTRGGDYAEYWEWEDGNPENEDRTGYFVTFNKNKVRIASSGDNLSKVGAVSAVPSVVGDGDIKEWRNKYERDIFGRVIYEDVEDENGNIIHRMKLNPDYDESQKYVKRKDRPEWSPIGTHGKLIVIDDGTCVEDGFCVPTDGGIATASDEGFYVMERLDENHIRIYMK